jgi:hypothetical protein
MGKSGSSGVVIILLVLAVIIPGPAYLLSVVNGNGGSLASMSKSSPSYRNLEYKIGDMRDSDSDGISDFEDPLPHTYGTITEDEYMAMVGGSISKSGEVFYALNDLFKGYDSGELTKDEFLKGLDTQEEIIMELTRKMNIVPVESYIKFHEFYFTSIYDQKNSVYYFRKYVDSGSDRDLYLARISNEIYLKNLQKAKNNS